MIRFDSLRIAIGGISANRLRSALTMLGMVIGVAVVIIVVAVGNGSSVTVAAGIDKLGTNLLEITPEPTFSTTGFTAGTSLTEADVTALSDKPTNPAIKQVAPVVKASSVEMSYNNTTYSPSEFYGSTPSYQTMHGYSMAGGTFFTEAQVKSHAQVLVVGQTVVEELFGGADPVGLQVRAGSGNFEVIGVLASKGSNGTQDLDDVAFAPYTAVQDQVAGYGDFSEIDVQAISAADITAAQAEATATIEEANQTTNAEPGFQVQNQATAISTLNSTNAVFTKLLTVIAAFSLLVGGIGVMNIMLVSVTERTREIGIRKTVGARRMDIATQFLSEAVLLSMLGGLLGVGAGLVASHFKIDGVQPVVAWYSVGLAFGVSVAIGLFFGLYPASRAAALPPAVALRRD